MRIFVRCPEIRSQIFNLYLSKLFAALNFVVFSPLILIGIVCILLIFVLEFLGQIFLWPTRKISEWLYRFQSEQISKAHSILTVEEIQQRLGIKQQDEDF